jgi:hypothetical protein
MVYDRYRYTFISLDLTVSISGKRRLDPHRSHGLGNIGELPQRHPGGKDHAA